MECKKYYFVYHGKIIGGKIAKSFGEIFHWTATFFIVGLVFIISLVPPFCSADWSALKNRSAIEDCLISRKLVGAN